MNETPDWLDSVLQPRPTDDDGFGARVTAIGRGRRRTRMLVRLLVGFTLALLVGSCFIVGLEGEARVLGSVAHTVERIDGRPWLDAHRQQYRAAVAKYDQRPGLRRRTGKDASAVLARDFDWTRCDRRVCDTSFFVGLAAYDSWLPPIDKTVQLWGLKTVAEQHLRAAIAAADVDGVPAFVAAADDVEAMGRLILGFSQSGAELFAVVARLTDEARVAGRDGGFKPTLTVEEAEEVRALWWIGDLYLAPAATDDDAAHVSGLQSVLACGAANHVWGFSGVVEFMDAATAARMATSPAGGCRVRPFRPADYDKSCDDGPPTCRASLWIVRMPPWRQHIAARANEFEVYVNELLGELLPVTP